VAEVDAQPITLLRPTVSIAGDGYSTVIERAEFTPEVAVDWLPGPMSTGAPVPIYGGTRWTCTLGYAQGFTAGSLSRYLQANAGARKTFVFTPREGGPSVTATVVLTPGPLGGAKGPFLTAEVTLYVVGDPVIA